MSTFHLQIVTPDRMMYDGEAERIIVRAVNGDVAILPHHIDYAVPLAIGKAQVTDAQGNTRLAACNSGMLSVHGNEVRVVAVTFEWADEIDLERARRAEESAHAEMEKLKLQDKDFSIAEARLKRALTRIHVND